MLEKYPACIAHHDLDTAELLGSCSTERCNRLWEMASPSSKGLHEKSPDATPWTEKSAPDVAASDRWIHCLRTPETWLNFAICRSRCKRHRDIDRGTSSSTTSSRSRRPSVSRGRFSKIRYAKAPRDLYSCTFENAVEGIPPRDLDTNFPRFDFVAQNLQSILRRPIGYSNVRNFVHRNFVKSTSPYSINCQVYVSG